MKNSKRSNFKNHSFENIPVKTQTMGKIRSVFNIINKEGIGYLFEIVKGRIFPKKIKHFGIIKNALKNKSGLEIGGPSWTFRDYNLIPVYRFIKNLDVCNFSTTTIWEGEIKDGKSFNFYKNKTGNQYIGEAADLSFIPDSKYEFIISSHCFEHIANPLKAFKEWMRVLKKEGYILILVPNKDTTFDHQRKPTKFSHLLEDYNNGIGENDFTHLDEILQLHDLEMDLKAGTFEEFKKRSLSNYEIRALHHHVFDIPLLKEIYLHFNMEILLTDVGEDVLIFGRKKD